MSKEKGKLNLNTSKTWKTRTAVLCYNAQGLSPHKITIALKGGSSLMFAHHGVAAFYREKKNRGYDSSPLLLFAHGVTARWNFG